MHYALIVFGTVFLAELGDKSQIAALLFSSKSDHSPWVIFFAASAAIIIPTGLAVIAGQAADKYLAALPLKLIAGIGFLLIGLLTIRDHFVS